MSRVGNFIDTRLSRVTEKIEGVRGLLNPRKVVAAGALTVTAITTAFGLTGTANVTTSNIGSAAAPAATQGFEPEAPAPSASSEDLSASTEVSTSVDDDANKVVQDIIDKYAEQAVAKDANLKLEDAKAYYKGLADFHFNNLAQEQARLDSIEKSVAQEITPEVEAKLKEKGLNIEDVALITDPNANFPGPREAGPNSMNHGKVVNTIIEGVQQTGDILNARNGFTEQDAEVARQALRNEGMADEVIDRIAAGDYETDQVQITYLTLNSNKAVFHGIAFNNDGEYGKDSYRSVGQQDTVTAVSWTNPDGSKMILTAREECSGGVVQPWDTIEIERPEIPAEPVAPELPTPTPAIQHASNSACIKLPDGTFSKITTTGEGMTQDQAQQDALNELEEAGEIVPDAECEPPTEETTTTTTTNPDGSTTTTTTTTTTSTIPNTTSTLVTTTTSTTTPDSTTTTTVGFEVCTNPDGSTTTIPLGTECKIDNHGTDGNGTAGTEQTNEQNGHDNHGDANNSGNGEGTEEGTELGATDTDINDSSSNHGTNSNTGNLPGSAGEVAASITFPPLSWILRKRRKRLAVIALGN